MPGDVAHRVALDQPSQDLPLPSREGREAGPRDLLGATALLPQLHQLLALFVADDRQALAQAPHHGEDVVERLVLRDHLARAALHALPPAGVVGRRGHDHDVHSRPRERLDQVGAVAELAEVEVDEGDPRLPAARRRQHLTCRAGVVGNGHPTYVVALERQRQLQGLGEQCVVLEDQDAHPAPGRGGMHRHHLSHPPVGITPPPSRLVLEPFMQLTTPNTAPCRR